MDVKHRTARILTQRLLSTSISRAASTLSEIRLLSKHDPDIRILFADSGLIPILNNFLLLQNQQQQQDHHQNQEEEEEEDDDDDDDDDDEELLFSIQENACATLLNISITTPESLMSTPSLLSSLSAALSSSNPCLPPLAAATIYSLLTVDAYRPIIGSKLPLISSLISLLTLKSSSIRTIKDSLKALFALALYPLNRPNLISLNAVPPLFALLRQSNQKLGIMEDASAVVAQVAGCYESVEAFRRVEGVRILVGMMRICGSERVKENAAAALLNMAKCGGEKAVVDIRDEAEDVVRVMAEDTKRSQRGRSKAEELLRLVTHFQFGSSFSFSSSSSSSLEDSTTVLPKCSSSASSSGLVGSS